MNVAIIGSGYVGLVTGACLADFGHSVTCMDHDERRIDALRAGDVPFYEPGLRELVLRNAAVGRLRFSTDIGDAVRCSTAIKLASNAFLAVKIGFMNEVANLCDRVGADVHVVAKGMGLDKRIGSKFLHPGPGYGGSCFPKDTRSLVAIGVERGAPQRIVEAAVDVNRTQRQLVIEKVTDALGGVQGRHVAVLGLSFKPNTDDVRESPAIYVCRELARAGAHVQAFDPVARATAARALKDAIGPGITLADDAYTAISGTCALIIMTEWNEFRGLDLRRVLGLMTYPLIVDTRNVLDPALTLALGFTYICTGRQAFARQQVVA